MKMTWKLERIDWHKHGLCWRWSRITKHVYYSGNQVQIMWGRIAFVFERREWIHCENAGGMARELAALDSDNSNDING